MKRGLFLFAAAWMLLLITSQGNADVIPGLYNTGVNDSGSVLSVNTIDIHYGLSGPTGTMAYVVPVPSVWITPPAGSYWIGPQIHSDPLTSDPAPYIYTYTLSFDLTNLNPDTAVITGSWASDNPSSILLNGTDTGFIQNSQFLALEAFSLNAGFVSGINYLQFNVLNIDNGMPSWGNPSGLLVSGLQGTASPVPEPTTMLLLGLGLVGLAGIRRKL